MPLNLPTLQEVQAARRTKSKKICRVDLDSPVPIGGNTRSSQRGDWMTCYIAGHKMTEAETRTLDAAIDYMRKHAGDSWVGPSTSPKGDGREVPVTDIFTVRTNQGAASRRTLKRLGDLGVLKSCELALERGCLRYVPLFDRPQHAKSATGDK